MFQSDLVKLTLFGVLLTVGCGPLRSETILVQCRLAVPEPDFLERIGVEPQANDRDVIKLTDIESYMLVQSKGQPLPAIVELSAARATRVFDDTRAGSQEYYVDVSAWTSWRGGSTLSVMAPEDSEFELRFPLVLDLPRNGSVILRSAKPEADGRYAYLWISTRVETDSTHAKLVTR